MNKKLPKRPNLDHLRRQAKTLLLELNRGDVEAARTFIKHLPAAKKMTPAKVRSAGYRLADAQSAVARMTGSASWPSLSRHVATLRSLEGDWRFESLEVDANAVPKAALTHSKILIDGDCFRTESPEANYEGEFAIDVDAKPPRIDIEFVDGPEAGNWSYGLFELDGDEVTFCLGLTGASRPTGFVTSAGSGHALERLRRATAARPANVTGGKALGSKAASSPPAVARTSVAVVTAAASASTKASDGEALTVDGAAFDVAVTPHMKRLAGEWLALELVRDGVKMQDDWLSYGSRKTEGNETKVVFGGQTMLHAKMRIDEKAKPMAVDYLNLAGAAQGRVSLGVLKWDGDDVTFHIAKPGKPRPRDFVCVKGSGATLSRWRKKTRA